MPRVQVREFTSYGRLVRIRWVKSREQYWAMIEGRRSVFEGDTYTEAKSQATAWCRRHQLTEQPTEQPTDPRVTEF